jgi:hypothetical protein
MDWVNLALPAVFATIGGLIVWFFESRAEKLRKVEESLQDRRLKLYSDTLDPFIRLFVGVSDEEGEGQAADQAFAELKSYEYRKAAFDLTMFGSDEVVLAYNAMWQHIFKEGSSAANIREMVRLWANILLAVRRSGVNPKTKLGERDILASGFKDLDTFAKRWAEDSTTN